MIYRFIFYHRVLSIFLSTQKEYLNLVLMTQNIVFTVFLQLTLGAQLKERLMLGEIKLIDDCSMSSCLKIVFLIDCLIFEFDKEHNLFI